VVRDHRLEERVLVPRRLERPDDAVQRRVERLGDRVEMLVGERLHLVDAPFDAEHLGEHAHDRLDVPVLVGDLRREEQLHVVVRCCEQERRQERRDVPLRVEAMGEDPDQPLARLGRQLGGRSRVGREVDLVGRPLVPFPVLVQRVERVRALNDVVECLLFHRQNLHRFPLSRA
jgi:hypothetical protein